MQRKTWTDEEVLFLKDNIDKFTLNELAEKMGRTMGSVVHKVTRLGIEERRYPSKKWTTEEENFLMENYKKIKITELMKIMSRTKESITNRANKLGLRGHLKLWTKAEVSYLTNKWGITTLERMSKHLDRTPESIKAKAVCLGLKEQAYANCVFLTPIDVAEILGIHRVTLYKMLKQNLIPHRRFKTGSQEKYQVSVENLLLFLEKRTDKWNVYKVDMVWIKSIFSIVNITRGKNFYISEKLPLWLLDKIKNDRVEKCSREQKRCAIKSRIQKKKYVPWTTKEEERLIYLINENIPLRDIYTHFNRSNRAIQSKIAKLKRNASIS